MDTNTMTLSALYNLIKSIQTGSFSFGNMTHEQCRNVVTLVRQHKLGSYIASIANIEADRLWFERLAEDQERLRSISEETCAHLAHAAAKSGLKMAVIKGLTFERCIYGNKRMRDVGDIDVLTLPQDAVALHNILLDMGYRQRTGPASVGAKGSRALAAICASQGSSN